ncbi:MAG: hypothetical protein JNL24_05430 [Bacteroidia bacterium]|nr:hypothetical protein [Bacteroidia bacterium]
MKKYLKLILFIVLVVAFFVSVRYNESSLISSLKKVGKKAIAEVVGVESGNKATYMVVEFTTDKGERIRVHPMCMYYKCSIFLNKKFTIIYNPEKPAGEYLLLYHRASFETFDMPFPDSLKWIDKYEGFFNFNTDDEK